jgi:type II secretory pathway component GspD/PulD (secretin)
MSATVYSQATKFSLEFKNVSIEQIFKEVERNSSFTFLYRIGLIDNQKKVNLAVKDATVESILDQLFEGTNVSYHVTENKLIIFMKMLNRFQMRDMQR